MKRRAAGHIIFIGATASRRGGAKTVAFASAKAAQRSLAESLARSLGPSGIHVSLIIIDGIVDEPSIRTKLADKLAAAAPALSTTIKSLFWRLRPDAEKFAAPVRRWAVNFGRRAPWDRAASVMPDGVPGPSALQRWRRPGAGARTVRKPAGRVPDFVHAPKRQI